LPEIRRHTNNVSASAWLLVDGTISTSRGPSRRGGYDLLGLVIGSEGQLGMVTEGTVRILRAAEVPADADGLRLGRGAGGCVAAIIASGIIPVAIGIYGPSRDQGLRARPCRLPLDVEALLIVEVEGSEPEIESLIAANHRIAEGFAPQTMRVSKSEAESAAIWKGTQVGVRAMAGFADYLCMDGASDRPHAGSAPAGERDLHRLRASRSPTSFTARRWQPASPDPVHANDSWNSGRPKRRRGHPQLCVEVGGCLTASTASGSRSATSCPTSTTPAT